MSEAAIYISLISLCISIMTFYFIHLRPAKLDCLVGSTIGINHQVEGFSIYVPFTFTNTAHRAGLVNRCSVVFSRSDQPPVSHYIEWTEFRKRNDDMNRYTREDFAGPLQIEGRSSISKLVWFRWTEGTYLFVEGRYVLEFFIWKENEVRPSIRLKHDFFITSRNVDRLAESKQEKTTKIEWVGLDKQIESNKLLTKHEVEVLLG